MLGFGRIGRALYEFNDEDPKFKLEYAYVRSEKDGLPAEKHVTDAERLTELPVDLCIEAAIPAVVDELGETVLGTSDVMLLSGSALIDPDVGSRLKAAAAENDTDIYFPHSALFGIDSLVDAGDTLESVSVVATKAPHHLDGSFTDEFDLDKITDRTVLYEGSV